MASRAAPPLTEKRLPGPARDQLPPVFAVPRPFETVRMKESVAAVSVAADAGETAPARNATKARTVTTTPAGRFEDMAKAPWSPPARNVDMPGGRVGRTAAEIRRSGERRESPEPAMRVGSRHLLQVCPQVRSALGFEVPARDQNMSRRELEAVPGGDPAARGRYRRSGPVGIVGGHALSSCGHAWTCIVAATSGPGIRWPIRRGRTSFGTGSNHN